MKVKDIQKIKADHEILILPYLAPPLMNSTDEIAVSQHYIEGAVTSTNVNAYERDINARKACLTKFGLSCRVCGFNFENTYGQLGVGYIHVHHIVPLADIRQQYEVNPVTDLIPLCANCHAMIHRRRPALTVDELRSQLHSVTSEKDAVPQDDSVDQQIDAAS